MGNTIEAYDFLIYALMAPLVFPRVFFPAQDTFTGVVLSFSTYFVAFLARPLGAMIFGHFDDRVGRRKTLIATVLMMGVGTFGVGLVPSYASIGPAGAVMLVLLRIVGGVALGGEWTGATLLALESGPRERSGRLTSFAQSANPLGMALATGAILTLRTTLSDDQLFSWGWRLPFLVSIALVVVGLWMRLKVHETLEFRNLQKSGRVSRHPLRDVARKQPAVLVACILIKMGEMVAYYVFTVFVLSYGSSLGYRGTTLLISVAGAALAAASVMPLVGAIGDRFGHAQVFRVSTILTGLFAFAYFPLLASGSVALAIPLIVVSLLLFAGVFAVEGAILSVAFAPAWRYSGGALAFNLAGIIGAGPAPMVATLAAHAGGAFAVAGYIAASCAVSAVAATYLVRKRIGAPAATSAPVDPAPSMGGA